jgi:hypothetical protein
VPKRWLVFRIDDDEVLFVRHYSEVPREMSAGCGGIVDASRVSAGSRDFMFGHRRLRAHREILHLARLLARIVEDLPCEKINRYLVRDAQRVIEGIEALVRIHTAQEEDIYDALAAPGP